MFVAFEDMKIYTSCFRNYDKLVSSGVTPVGIALKTPTFVPNDIHTYLTLAPNWPLIRDYKRDGDIPKYRAGYSKIVGNLSAEQVIIDLLSMSNGGPLAILCWEKAGDFCHRRLVADWLQIHLGLNVPEWSTSNGSQLSLNI